MILVDSSVLVDLLEKTPEWFKWCSEQLSLAQQWSSLWINALVSVEISRTFKARFFTVHMRAPRQYPNDARC
jgi:beta-mannanase